MAKTSSKLVLVIDDDEDVRDMTKLLIEKLGYRADTAEDGAKGLDKIKKLKPALVILDLMMPNVNGFEVLEKLKAENMSVRVVVITAYSEFPDREKFRKGLEVSELMKKPVRHEELEALLKRFVG